VARVLVCGLGQVGFRVARLLARLGETTSVLSVDAREEFSQELVPFGVTVEIGDARADRCLLAAGVSDAETVIACTDDDLVNIEIALDAKRLNPGVRVVARLFDQTLARRLTQSGIVDQAFGMSALAAPAFAAAAMGREIVGQFEWQGKLYAVQEVSGEGIDGSGHGIVPIQVERNQTLPKRSDWRAGLKFVGQVWIGAPRPLQAILLSITLLGFLSVGVFYLSMGLSPIDALYFVTTTLTTTGYGDITPRDHATWVKVYTCFLMVLGSAAIATLYSLLTDYIVSERFNQLLGRQQVLHSGHVIVAGLGNVGFRTANQLVAAGSDVVVLDVSASPEYRGFLEKEMLFLVGDARDPLVLERAAIEKAAAVIAATDDDAINLSICLAAKELNPDCRVVARLFDDRFAEKVQQATEVDTALSASRIAAPRFVGTAIEPSSLFSFVAQNSLISILPPRAGESDFHAVRRPLPG
jgi:Trk K+ transport system NAD-binding subunit